MPIDNSEVKAKKSKSSTSNKSSAPPGPSGPRAPNHAHKYVLEKDEPDVRSHLAAPHVESFNYFINEGLPLAVENLLPITLERPNEDGGGQRLTMTISSVRMSSPIKSEDCKDPRLLPGECRHLRSTYRAPLYATLVFTLEGGGSVEIDRKVGNVPLMVKSRHCHLYGKTQSELVKMGEEPYEFGGFFIANGNEKAVRLLSLQRRNYVMAIIRPSFTKRGTQYTKYGCMLRCVRADQTGSTVTLHYLNTGNCTLSVKIRKQEYLIPVILILKALTGSSDEHIYTHVMAGDKDNTFVSDRIEVALRDGNRLAGLKTREHYLAYLGARFRPVVQRALFLTDRESDADIARALIKHFICVHVDKETEKWQVLILMMQKLYALVNGSIQPDSPDSLHCQEVLLPGHLMTMMVKEKLQDYLVGMKEVYQKDLRGAAAGGGGQMADKVNLSDRDYYESLVMRCPVDIGRKLEYFISTGNLISQSGLDLSQVSGYTIVAERLNFLRYLSHYRSIHRGQFFTTMKSTAVRKLLPEAWGFVCPVHTPDGGPCGLLNHLTSVCQLRSSPPPAEQVEAVVEALYSLGVTPLTDVMLTKEHIPVLLDGRLVGRCLAADASRAVAGLRDIKAVSPPASGSGSGAASSPPPTRRVPEFLEAGLVLPRTNGLWPGIFLFTTPGRMMRPVMQLHTGRCEWIGTLEQIHMDIAVTAKEVDPRHHTHMELSPMNMLSVVAQCTPFSDMNQSPRNMYQCQMGKQTMGSPMFAYSHRCDNKSYRILTPQMPLVRNAAQDTFRMDDYPMGTNAVVAVISYTGYDMEDAMIINKAAYDRGFGAGHVYTYTIVDLEKAAPNGSRFANPQGEGHIAHLGLDGLPEVGSKLTAGMALWRAVDATTGKSKTGLVKSAEDIQVDQVRLMGDGADKPLKRVGIKLRYDRRPTIGDKFSSRHGQKGVLSTLWPAHNMPFSENGIIPDVIINPNAFPSRMTIGMLIESMAGKAAAMHGYFPDSTPFRFDEHNRAVDHFGEQLRAAGYNYYGTETLYSGVSGKMMEAEIFMGLVYYQRLRHMVSDKYQVRSTGPVNKYTRQPVKGRKAGGGVRFGEMERDGLLSHGASYLLRDRLLTCSDITTADVCRKCGSLISTTRLAPDEAQSGAGAGGGGKLRGRQKMVCVSCKDGSDVVCVTLPFVFRYLLAELAAMNINVLCQV